MDATEYLFIGGACDGYKLQVPFDSERVMMPVRPVFNNWPFGEMLYETYQRETSNGKTVYKLIEGK